MKYLSVCSGIEAATVAWHPLGWNPVAYSEIEKFPSKILQHHYPDVPNYGDMNDFKKWPRSDIDVLVGGTPCQSFSVAGLRAGMDDPRGNLALIYLAIAERFSPNWLVWENVPGVLSSDGGRDFAAIIGGMVKLGYGISYRVLDAQYFGVPQRRRRVFVVGCLGDWRGAAKVLFEPESLRRNPPPSRESRQGATNGIAKSLRGCSGGIDREDMHTLIPDVANPLTARMHKGINTTCDEGQTPIPVMAFSSKDYGGDAGPVSPPLRAMGGVDSNDAGGGSAAVAYGFKPGQGKNARSDGVAVEQAPTLSADQGGNAIPAVASNMAVRRLTPRECERLQGFPDDYTLIPGGSDSGRYKALGNSMAVPVMHWIGSRINEMC